MSVGKLSLWIFGLVPAVAWLLYTIAFTIAALRAAPSSPLFAVLYAALGALVIWGTSTIILLILEKPAKNAKYGLIATLIALVPMVLGGLSGVGGYAELALFFAALSLLIVTVYLLRTTSNK